MLHFKVIVKTEITEMLSDLVISRKAISSQGFSSSAILTEWLVKVLNCNESSAENALEDWYDHFGHELNIPECDDLELLYDYDELDEEYKYELYRVERTFKLVENSEDESF